MTEVERQTKSMDDLNLNFEIKCGEWSAIYSLGADEVAIFRGNRKMVTLMSVDEEEFSYGDVIELVQEVNVFLDARGFGFQISGYPRMRCITELMKGENGQ